MIDKLFELQQAILWTSFLIALTAIAIGHWQKFKEAKKAKATTWPGNYCPRCTTQFSDWFHWPGRGSFCWPCYKETRRVITRETEIKKADTVSPHMEWFFQKYKP